MDLNHRPSTAQLSAELDGAAQRALDATVPRATRKEVERYSELPTYGTNISLTANGRMQVSSEGRQTGALPPGGAKTRPPPVDELAALSPDPSLPDSDSDLQNLRKHEVSLLYADLRLVDV